MADEPKKTLLPDQSYHTGNDPQTIWIQYPYGVKLESDPRAILHSIVEAEKYIMEDDADEKTVDEYLDVLRTGNGTTTGGLGGEYDKWGVTSDAEIARYFTQSSLADTRVGCNDAINPYWQFNRDDDICPPGLVPTEFAADQAYSTNSNRFHRELKHASGMGRVYAEMYDSQQQILWIEAGVPRFTNLLDYYSDAADKDVATALNSGNISVFASKLASLAIQGAVWAFFFPIMSLIWIPRWMERLTNERITKYYTFRSTMTMYYSTVNAMLQYTAISMGLHPLTLQHHPAENGVANGADIEHAYDIRQENDQQVEIKYVEQTVPVIEYDANGRRTVRQETKRVRQIVPVEQTYDANYRGVPEILRRGPDIFRIMNRRSQMIDLKKATYTTEELYKLADGKDADVFVPDEGDPQQKDGIWSFLHDATSSWWSTLKGSILGSGNHVGFKIEKGANFSEDFANTTGETGLAEKFNQ